MKKQLRKQLERARKRLRVVTASIVSEIDVALLADNEEQARALLERYGLSDPTETAKQ